MGTYAPQSLFIKNNFSLPKYIGVLIIKRMPKYFFFLRKVLTNSFHKNSLRGYLHTSVTVYQKQFSLPKYVGVLIIKRKPKYIFFLRKVLTNSFHKNSLRGVNKFVKKKIGTVKWVR